MEPDDLEIGELSIPDLDSITETMLDEYEDPTIDPIDRSKLPHRLTVVEQIYRQSLSTDEPPFETRFGYNRELKSKEQVYTRNTNATDIYQKLDTGWVDRCAILIIANLEGNFPYRIPTPEELKEAMENELHLTYTPEQPEFHFPILPQEHLRVTPNPDCPLFIRCVKELAAITIIAVPE